MHLPITTLLLLTLIGATPVAHAEVKQTDASSATIEVKMPIARSTKAVWQLLVSPQRWWSDAHTWSGHARHLRLDPRAGGCWCERWAGNEVEHGRVIGWQPQRGLRLQGAFGPLQAQAVVGLMDFQLEGDKSASVLTLTYRLAGPTSAQLDKLAPLVDRVLEEQLTRLKVLAQDK
jgi:uncharacterized protein YndB with AHSA1/START domain